KSGQQNKIHHIGINDSKQENKDHNQDDDKDDDEDDKDDENENENNNESISKQFVKELFVSQRYVRIYDLAKQVWFKKLLPGARWLNSIDIHHGGDNLIASSFDKRVIWHDLELSNTPYKTLQYHEKAVRSIKFHEGGLPLFASSNSDGSIDFMGWFIMIL
ncbi:uncharacterized protein ASCRUDRAFT_10740, partial [Ascoidea rubescens DSM 1968]